MPLISGQEAKNGLFKNKCLTDGNSLAQQLIKVSTENGKMDSAGTDDLLSVRVFGSYTMNYFE
eukprot:762605-Hanusia_phi.AAC.5